MAKDLSSSAIAGLAVAEAKKQVQGMAVMQSLKQLEQFLNTGTFVRRQLNFLTLQPHVVMS